MLPKWHILFGALFTIVLYFALNVSFFHSLIFFFSSFLIDIDHCFYYVYRKKNFSFKRAYNWFLLLENKFYSLPKGKRRRYDYGFCIFHGIEVLLILLLLSLIPELSFFFFIFLGFLFHLVQDMLNAICKGGNPFMVLSIIYKITCGKYKINLEDRIENTSY